MPDGDTEHAFETAMEQYLTTVGRCAKATPRVSRQTGAVSWARFPHSSGHPVPKYPGASIGNRQVGGNCLTEVPWLPAGGTAHTGERSCRRTWG